MRARLTCAVSLLLLALAGCEVKVNEDSDAGGRSDASVKDGGDEADSGGDPDSGPEGATFDCSQRGLTPTTTVNKDVMADTTWSGVVLVQGEVDVLEPATLTIKPGTLIVMDSDSNLTIGWNSGTAKINAAGTAREPIRFCGKRADAGYYKQILIERNVKTDSVLQHVLVADGGGSGANAALQVDASILLEDVLVENSGANGLAARSFKQGSKNLSVKGSTKHAVSVETALAVHNFPSGGTFTNNHDDVIQLDFIEITADTTFGNHGVPYRYAKAIDIKGGEVHIAAGVEQQFTADTGLIVGWNSTACSFFVDGTSDKPVVMRGVEATSGYWNGVQFERNVRSESKLRYLKLSHAGGNDHVPLDIAANIAIDHVTLDKNKAAARLHASLGPSSAALTITGSDDVPLETDLSSAITLPTDSKFMGNHADFISLTGQEYTASGTLPRFDVPYRVEASIDLKEPSELTIAPGVIFVMTADTQLTFGWNSGDTSITAKGNADNPIVFRGAMDTAGFWNGLVVERNVRTDSAFDYIEVTNAGQSGNAALVFDANVPLTHSTIKKSAGDGIWAEMDLTVDYSATNTFSEIAGMNVVER